MNTTGTSRDVVLIRAYKATVGATDGNIIAAIMTTQTPRNHPKLPRPVQGPLSMPRICPDRPPPANASEREEEATSPS